MSTNRAAVLRLRQLAGRVRDLTAGRFQFDWTRGPPFVTAPPFLTRLFDAAAQHMLGMRRSPAIG
jgi:hypothetical protein